MDSVMSYLDRGGRHHARAGEVIGTSKVMRGKSLIGTVDLYDFALRGKCLPSGSRMGT